MPHYRWAIVGLGTIATQFADTFNPELGELYGAASRHLERAQSFAAKHHISKAFGSYEELFADPMVDIVYIATPHNHHLESIIPALENGKHVLCEKAITLNSKELAQAKQLASEKGLILAEAMTIFYMPLYLTLRERINTGEFGKLKMIQASFGSFKEADPTNRFFNPDLAGGAILDIGTYALSFVRFFLSAQPTFIQSTMAPFETGVDEQSVTILRNENDEMATVALTFQSKMPKQGIVAFEKAFITINEFPRADTAMITYLDGQIETLQSGEEALALNYEVSNMTQFIDGTLPNDSLNLTTDVVALMDRMRAQW
ncbi:Gfo/Idh/MocA family oxidoreductase [uncultured Vagococcus sp.]|uniref:Gfo/Idh/MocA family protein n=1 Tax=uncultured Vagococcus sp. TaxID=189676 RepID=UPI0028D5FFB8|nr:Gfo/Idh/MocA family oxidoreductase [uncultured Vagococcus sp.]